MAEILFLGATSFALAMLALVVVIVLKETFTPPTK